MATTQHFSMPSPPSELVAARLMSRFLVDPLSAEPEPRLADMSAEEEEALHAILATLGISEGEVRTSDVARQRVLDAISKSIRARSLTPDVLEKAGARLGNEGSLPDSLYQIALDPRGPARLFLELGEQRDAILNVVRKANAVQHLSHRGDSQIPEAMGQSIFVRQMTPRKSEPYAHIAVMSRKGTQLQFESVWRVFPSVVRVLEGSTPLDLLRAFVEHYGVSFALPNRPLTKFIVQDAIPDFPPGTNLMSYLVNETGAVFAGVHDGPELRAQGAFKRTPFGITEIDFTFVVNMTRYASDFHALAR